MQIIIDGYGEPTPFDSIKEAQSELRSIGEEWEGITLTIPPGSIEVRNEDDEIVGFVRECPVTEDATHGGK